MSDDELDEAVPMSPAEKAVQFFKGDQETPINPKEITEAMLKQLHENLQELDHLEKLVEMQKQDIKRLAAGEESVLRGNYAAFLKPVKGRKSVKWEKFAKAMIGEIKESDLLKYTEESEPSVRLEIKKLG